MRCIFSIVFLILIGSIQAQLPVQYEYVDEDCSAILSSYLGMVVVADNCELVSIIQAPAPGTFITATTGVTITATDATGNQIMMFFDVVLIDTLPPTMMLNPEWQGYSDKEVSDMYRTFYGWVQKSGVEINELYAGKEYYFEPWDTILVTDTFKVFSNTIPIPDTMTGFWWESAPDLTLSFK